MSNKSPLLSLRDEARLLECVPNFSEGVNRAVIHQIATKIDSIPGVQVLHTDIGESANRTVITFIGIPEAVVEAAFQAIQFASEVIDMQVHKGEHPRMGATDVCPLIPYKGVSMEEAVAYSQDLGQRVGEELGIPVYLYEASASKEERKNLATIRSGEYEGFREKIKQAAWKPDFGPQVFHPRAGQTVIGAREFLVAYNLNLNTDSVPIAKQIAADIRESGQIKRVNGQVVRDAMGKPIRIPGKCKGLKAIGWYMEQFGIAQVSTNLTNLKQTPLHIAFEAAKSSAIRHGVEVTGSELVGMIPLNSILETGGYFQKKILSPMNLSELELIDLVIKELGLNELKPFDPRKKIIEYRIE